MQREDGNFGGSAGKTSANDPTTYHIVEMRRGIEVSMLRGRGRMSSGNNSRFKWFSSVQEDSQSARYITARRFTNHYERSQAASIVYIPTSRTLDYF